MKRTTSPRASKPPKQPPRSGPLKSALANRNAAHSPAARSQKAAPAKTGKPRSAFLESLTWQAAEKLLTPEAIVLIPLGATSKEHGPHLPLNTDAIQADYLATKLATRCSVVVAPLIGFHYYPAFTEYPGSICLRRSTAVALVVDICQSLTRFGPRKFYVLNTGFSTVEPLAQSAKVLARQQLLMRFSNFQNLESGPAKRIGSQPGGSHADELETSKMLKIAPACVHMSRAIDEYDPHAPPGGLTRTPGRSTAAYSKTGVWGYPTLASPKKGAALLALLLDLLVNDIENLRAARLP